MKKSLKDLWKLTNFEFERMSKFLYALMGFTLVSNFIAYILLPVRFMNRVNEFLAGNMASIEQTRSMFGTFSFYTITNSLWIVGPIIVGITGLLLYSFFTWYREWFGKNTFAYRLLLLPTARMNIFFAKLITIFTGIFSLIATQMLSLAIGYPIVSMIVDSDFLANIRLIEALNMNLTFHYIFPMNTWMFLAVNGIGLVLLLVLFSVILMERSFGWRGIIMGIVYASSSLILILFPFAIPRLAQNYYILYSSETVLIEVVLFALVGLLSILISRYLINHKITV